MKKENCIIILIILLTLFSGGTIFFLKKQDKSLTTEQISTHQSAKNREKDPQKQPVNNSQSPLPIPNNNYSKKTLFNAIKNDLQDALTNESRWTSGYFNDYWIYDSGGLRVNWLVPANDNQDLAKELAENFKRNYARRKAKQEKDKKEHETKGYVYPKSLENKWEELNQEEIWPDELEPEDRREIVNLIFSIKSFAQEKEEQRRQDVEEKFASSPNCFAWGKPGSCVRTFIDSANIAKEFYIFARKENKKVFHVNIPKNHPSLNKFSLGKPGFYLINGVDKLSFEPSPHNSYAAQEFFHKWVDLTDKITITST